MSQTAMMDSDVPRSGPGCIAWYAVQTKARHEFQVEERLTGSGIETFLPSIVRTRKWKDRTKRIRFPLFPGYLFAHLDDQPSSRLALLKTKGVVGILGSSSGIPEPVPFEQIAALRKLTESSMEFDLHPYLQEGQRVRIKSGPLAGIEGILKQKTDCNVLILSVDILRQSTAVTINAEFVETV